MAQSAGPIGWDSAFRGQGRTTGCAKGRSGGFGIAGDIANRGVVNGGSDRTGGFY